MNKWRSYNTAWLAQRGCEANCAWKGVARRSSSHSVRDNGWRMTSGGTRRAKPRWARPGATSPAAGEIQRTRLVAQEQHGNFSAELAPEANAWDFPQRPPRCRLLGDLALSQGGIRLQGPPVAPLPPLAPPGCDAAGAWSSCRTVQRAANGPAPSGLAAQPTTCGQRSWESAARYLCPTGEYRIRYTGR